MKQFEPKEVTISEVKYYIFPFPAFKSANILGELTAVITPMIGSMFPMIQGGSDRGLLDVDIDKAAPAISGAFNSLSGDKLESLLKKLLITNKNITVEADDGEPQRLTEELVNELFCGEAQDMFILAFEVIRNNFNGFFKKLGTQFGTVAENLTKNKTSLANMANLI